MQTYSFDELDERGQEAAAALYCNDPQALGLVRDCGSIFFALAALPWRYTEHGERVA